jgi:hypothetical protein
MCTGCDLMCYTPARVRAQCRCLLCLVLCWCMVALLVLWPVPKITGVVLTGLCLAWGMGGCPKVLAHVPKPWALSLLAALSLKTLAGCGRVGF